MTPQSIITLARDPLNDTDAVTPRASDAELVRAVNAGIKELAIIQPALFTRVHSFTCAAGAEQTLDYATDIAMVNVLSIHNGAGLTPFDRASLDAFKPAWRSDAQAAAQQWASIEGSTLRFLVYPPSTNGQVLDVESVRVPAEYALNDSITELPAAVEPALARFVVHWCESKDDEHVNSGRSAASYQAFVNLVKGAPA
jgi:hypothetical protein